MKRNYFVLILFISVIPSMIFGQNLVVNGDLESWADANTPDGWVLFENISQESGTVNGGSYSAAHLSESSSKKFRQDIQGIVGGQQYTIGYYFFDNDDNAKTRIWSYWMDADGTYLSNEDDDVIRPGEYSENSPDWQQFSEVITAPANASQFRFEVSMEGSSTNYPEPTNYPADFEATADGFVVDVNWTDATGDQLPGAYLLLGQTGSSGVFDLPVDGTPVLDDLDWNDGKVAVNVAYGIEMYAFGGLSGGQEYEFTIFPYTNAGANINYKTDGTPPYDKTTTTSILVINDENFEGGTDLGTWWQYDVDGPQSWENYEHNGERFARMSGWDNGAVPNEDWLISPELDLSQYQSVKFEFDNARNFPGEDVQLLVSSLNYDGEGNPNDYTWFDLSDEVSWSDDDWNWTASGVIDLSLFISSSVYLGFKYVSDNSAAASWEVDNIIIYSESGLGLIEQTLQQLKTYPNPASNMVMVETPEKGRIQILNTAGQCALDLKVASGVNHIDIQELPVGLYIVRFLSDNGTTRISKIIVE
jgi:hypothetical protein